MFQELVGKEVVYVSGSGREYKSVITAIPSRPMHGKHHLPTVSLEFRDERNKLVRKERVLPDGIGYKRKIWKCS